jgi:hypothetical protein
VLEGLQGREPRRIVALSRESGCGYRGGHGYDAKCPYAHKIRAVSCEKAEQRLGVVSVPGIVVASCNFGGLHGSDSCRVS